MKSSCLVCQVLSVSLNGCLQEQHEASPFLLLLLSALPGLDALRNFFVNSIEGFLYR